MEGRPGATKSIPVTDPQIEEVALGQLNENESNDYESNSDYVFSVSWAKIQTSPIGSSC